MGVFPWDRLTDAVAVVLASAARERADRKELADWRRVAEKLAARKAAATS